MKCNWITPAIFIVGIPVAIVASVGYYQHRDTIYPPRCAKVKCTAIRDTQWIIGEPLPEKDVRCKCLVYEER